MGGRLRPLRSTARPKYLSVWINTPRTPNQLGPMPKAEPMSARAKNPMLAVLATASLLCVAPPAGAQDAPALVGTWTLNIDKTEPAKDEVIEDAEGTGAGRTMSTGLGGRGASRRTGSVAGGSGVYGILSCCCGAQKPATQRQP